MSQNQPPQDASEALRALAENPQPAKASRQDAASPQAADPADPADPQEFDIQAEVDDESGEMIAQIDFQEEEPAAAAPRRTVIRRPPPDNLKAVAAPVLITVGLLLLIPGCWSLMWFTGLAGEQNDPEESRMMAILMLAAWPIAACLLGAGVFYFKQHRKARQAWEAENQPAAPAVLDPGSGQPPKA